MMCILFMVTLVPVAWSNSGNNEQSVLLVTGEWPPFTSRTMDQGGFVAALVTRVFERMNQPYEIRFMPWKRSVVMVEKGDAFATFPYRITDKRRKKHHFSNAVTTSSGRLFYLDSQFPEGIQWQEYNDLKNYTIGGTLGYWYETTFHQADLDTEFVRDDMLNFRKLVFGRVDMVAAAERVGWHILRQHFPDTVDNVELAQKPLDESTLHLMVSRDYPESERLLERFNRHLREFKKSPAFKQLKNRYDAFSRANARPPREGSE